MKEVRNIAVLLKKSEAQRFVNYLYPQQKPDKMLKLFRLLYKARKQKISRQELLAIEKEIYPEAKKGNRFDVLHHRLREDILDFLISNSFLNKHPVLEKLHAARMELSKKWMQQYILHLTGRTGSLRDALLDESIALAEKYGYYSDLIKLLHAKRIDRGYRFGEREINKLSAKIKEYEKCDRAVRRANELYYRLVILTKFHINYDKKKLLQYEEKVLSELNRLYKQTHAAEILYFIKYIEIGFYQNKHEYQKAKKSVSELLRAIHALPVFTRTRLDYAHSNYAQCCIYLEDYGEALKAIRELRYITSAPRDWAESKEIELRILFYQKKYKEAKLLLNKINNNLPEDAEPVRMGRLKFYEVCILFMQKEFKAAQKIILQKSILAKDKTGWGISLRMLELMLNTEKRNQRACLRDAKRLKRFLQRKDIKISKRDVIMADLFLLMAENNFEYSKFKSQFRRTLNLFQTKKGDYAWDAMSHEIMRYDEWMARYKP